MKYTFEIQWPAPFRQGWQRSGKRFESIADTATAMADFLAISFENDCVMQGRLAKVE